MPHQLDVFAICRNVVHELKPAQVCALIDMCQRRFVGVFPQLPRPARRNLGLRVGAWFCGRPPRYGVEQVSSEALFFGSRRANYFMHAIPERNQALVLVTDPLRQRESAWRYVRTTVDKLRALFPDESGLIAFQRMRKGADWLGFLSHHDRLAMREAELAGRAIRVPSKRQMGSLHQYGRMQLGEAGTAPFSVSIKE